MHTVALRTETTIPGGETPADLGQVLKNHMSEMFAYHATIMSNTLQTSIVVFTRTGSMVILLNHYRPSGTIFSFTDEILAYLANNCCCCSTYMERVRQRLPLYQGVCPIQMEFSDDAEKTFGDALSYLLFVDFVNHNAFELLTRYGITHLVFNDDIHVTFHGKVAQSPWCPCLDYNIPAVSIKDYST
ncbi:unnamed protein product, partial [Urochloa humidicola]